MKLTGVAKVRIPEPDVGESEYIKKLYEAIREMQKELEMDISSISLDNFSDYGIKQLDEKYSEVVTE